MKTRGFVGLGGLAAVAVAVLALGPACKKAAEQGGETNSPAAPPAVAQAACEGAACTDAGTYRCPMEECQYTQQGPGRCPKCGMNLEPVPPEAAPGTGPAAAAAVAVATAAVAAEVKTAADLASDRIGQSATCPVTGETFTVTAETSAVEHEGQVHLFCCPACAPRFLANPSQFMGGAPPAGTDGGHMGHMH